MKCWRVMRADVECCRRGDPVEAVAERMRRLDVGFMPVCDGGGVVVGTVTDRDLAVRVLGEHRDARRTLVDEVMSREVVSCLPDDDLDVAEDLMERHKTSRVICVDERGRACGVISLPDVARVEQRARAAEILQATLQWAP
ncbi:MAG TPA: CBS domain-containing protein [Polyangiaceae bacterium]